MRMAKDGEVVEEERGRQRKMRLAKEGGKGKLSKEGWQRQESFNKE